MSLASAWPVAFQDDTAFPVVDTIHLGKQSKHMAIVQM